MTAPCTPDHPDLHPFRAVVLDIEGTTTPIAFVHDVLFPYAADALEGFLESRWQDDEVQACVRMLAEQAAEDMAAGREGAVAIPEEPEQARREATLASCRWLMAHDRKVTGLKALQGVMWRDGYRTGELRGQVYEDVPTALRRWSEAAIPVHIYSSGSIEAQKLLFGHSTAGDLTPLLSGHFDTTTGHKREAASYQAIVDEIGLPAEQVLFLTDVVQEAQAAREAGLQAAILDRPGNLPQPAHDLPVLKDFEPVGPGSG